MTPAHRKHPARWWSLAVLAAALLAACAPRATVVGRTSLDVRPLHVAMDSQGSRLDRLGPPGAGNAIDMTVRITVTNSNPFPVRLDRIGYDISAAGVRLVEGVVHDVGHLAAGEVRDVELRVERSLPRDADLLRAAARAYVGEALRVAVRGTTAFATDAAQFETRRAILATGTVLPSENLTPPRITALPDQARAILVRPGAPVVRIPIRFENPGSIGTFVTSSALLLTLEGRPVAYLDFDPLPLAAFEVAVVDVAFYPDADLMDATARAALEDALAGKPVAFEVSGPLALDLLGVDSYPLEGGLDVRGTLPAR